MTRIVGVLQARMGSSRLPGKALRPLAGRPLVWHMVDRMRRTGLCEELVLATTSDLRNEPLVNFAEQEGLMVVRAEMEDDLADRIALAVKATGADYILKTAGDCPLIDPAVMTEMVRQGVAAGADFCSNRVRWSYPLGLSCDVISARSILWCDEHLTSAEDRELFAVYIRDHPEQFKVVSLEHQEDLSEHGWTVDTPEDFTFVSSIFDNLYRDGECFGLDDTLRFLSESD